MACRPADLTFERIRARAYELWERNHRPDGFEIPFWLPAERELRAESRTISGKLRVEEPPLGKAADDKSS